jgi:hypothetical protein
VRPQPLSLKSVLNRKTKAPLLVRDAPHLVRYQTVLTDGHDAFLVTERHHRHGVAHFRLVNVEDPSRAGWFSIDDMAELAFAQPERRMSREEW